MSYGTGLDASIGFSTESSFNTFTAPTTFLPLTSETLELHNNYVESAGLRGGLTQSVLDTQNRKSWWYAGGSVTLDVQNVGMGILFDHALGSSSETHSGSIYTWVHTLGGVAGKSLGCQVGKPSTDGTVNVFSYTGGKVADWQINLDTGGLMSMGLNLEFSEERSVAGAPVISSITQTGSAGTTTYYYRVAAIVGGVEQDLGPQVATTTSNATLSGSNYNVVSWSAVTGASGYNVYRSTTSNAGLKLAAGTNVATTSFSDQSNTVGSGAARNPAILTTPSYNSSLAAFGYADVSTLTLAGSTVAAVTKMSIGSKVPLSGGGPYLGQGGIRSERVQGGLREVSGTLEADFVSLGALYAAFKANTSLAAVIKATSTSIVSGTTPYSIQFDLPAIKLRGKTPNVAGPEALKVTIPWTGYETASTKALTVTRVTSDTTVT